jgi:hypothetical protein
MKGKYFLITGGFFLLVIGVLFLLNCVSAFRFLDGEIYGAAFRFFFIMLPSGVIVSGILGIIAGISSNGTMLTLSQQIGLKLALLPVLLLGAALAAVTQRYLIVPFFADVISRYSLDAVGEKTLFFLTLLVTSVFIHIYLTGIEAAKEGEWSPFVISRSVTRLLFFTVILVIVFNKWESFGLPQDMNMLSVAFCGGWSLILFEGIRGRDKERGHITIIIRTVICIFAIALYIVIIILLKDILGWIFALTPLISVIGIVLLLLLSCNMSDQGK